MPKECANEPKPPRCTPPELDSEPPEPEWPDEASLDDEPPEKKPYRDELPPEPPWPPDEDPRGWQSVGAAVPGGVCWQVSRGIIA